MALSRKNRSKSQQTNVRVARLPRTLTLKPEVKYVDFALTSAITYTGVSYNISDIPQGDTGSQRSGSVVHPLSLYVEGRITLGAAASPSTVRFMVIRLLLDRANWSAASVLSAVASQFTVESAYNRDFYGQSKVDRRFEVIFDRIYDVSTNYKPVGRVSCRKTLNGEHSLIRWDSLGDPVYGAIMCVMWSNVVSNGPTFTGFTRLEYLDA